MQMLSLHSIQHKTRDVLGICPCECRHCIQYSTKRVKQLEISRWLGRLTAGQCVSYSLIDAGSVLLPAQFFFCFSFLGAWCEEEPQVCMTTSMHALQHKTREATGNFQVVGARRRQSVYAYKYACITAQNTRSNWKLPGGWCEGEAQGRVPTSAGSSIAWSSLILMILIITICSPQWRRGF
jgi:hypothetical protein